MKFIRIILFYVLIIPATAFAALVCALWIIGIPFSIRYKTVVYWGRFFIWLAKCLLGLKFKLHGFKHIPKTPCIFFSNHQSMWETVFTTAYLPTHSWIIKKELLSVPFFGWGIKHLEPIVVDRKKTSSIKQILKQGQALLNLKKRCVVLYPQGTRIPYGETGRYTRSTAKLAMVANRPIVPMAHNAGKFWPKGFFPKQTGTIHVSFGQPIDPKDKTLEEIQQLAVDWIEKEIYRY